LTWPRRKGKKSEVGGLADHQTEIDLTPLESLCFGGHRHSCPRAAGSIHTAHTALVEAEREKNRFQAFRSGPVTVAFCSNGSGSVGHSFREWKAVMVWGRPTGRREKKTGIEEDRRRGQNRVNGGITRYLPEGRALSLQFFKQRMLVIGRVALSN